MAASDGDHILYALELVMFAFVGWGWLAVRERMGQTPVLDVAVLVSFLVCACVNLTLSLVLYTTERFVGPARAFFSHTLALWVLYVFGLVQSSGSGLVACKTGVFGLQTTYAAAFFGGLSYHQAAGAVTVAFLTFVVILSSGQVRVCTEAPSTWLAPGTGQAVLVLAGLFLVLFAFKAPLQGAAHVYCAVACSVFLGILYLSMPRLDWVRSIPAIRACLGSGDRDGDIQFGMECALMGIAFGLCFAIGWIVGGSMQLFLLGLGFAVSLGQVVSWVLREEEEDTSPSAPPQEGISPPIPAPKSIPTVPNTGSEMVVPDGVRVLVSRRSKGRGEKGQ